jgi:hypothetical protein
VKHVLKYSSDAFEGTTWVNINETDIDVVGFEKSRNSMSDPPTQMDEKNRIKWNRIISKGVTATIREQPDMFLRRVRRGIPDDYR